jgi:hypothetical protein
VLEQPYSARIRVGSRPNPVLFIYLSFCKRMLLYVAALKYVETLPSVLEKEIAKASL